MKNEGDIRQEDDRNECDQRSHLSHLHFKLYFRSSQKYIKNVFLLLHKGTTVWEPSIKAVRKLNDLQVAHEGNTPHTSNTPLLTFSFYLSVVIKRESYNRAVQNSHVTTT